MDERRLQAFVAVARSGGFSSAARALHLSQPAVSQQIAALEGEIGARLFERRARGVELTAAGSVLLDRADAILREVAAARRAVAATRGDVAGDLAIAASQTIGGYVLPPALAELGGRHPALRPRLELANSARVLEIVRAGAADAGFVEGPADSTGVERHELFEDELVVIAPASHRFALTGQIELTELARESLVVRERGSGTRQVAEAWLAGAGLPPERLRVAAELSGIEATRSAVAAGLGVAIVSRSAIAVELRAGTLIAASIAGLPMRRRFAAVLATGTSMSPAVRILIELVRAQAP